MLGGPSALLVDPLGFDAGDSNLYRYVSNSPTDVTDSTGTNEEFPAPETPPLPAVLTKDHLITTKELEAKVQVLGKRGSLIEAVDGPGWEPVRRISSGGFV